MTIPRDKLLHLAAGLVASGFGLLLWVAFDLALDVGRAALPPVVLAATLTAAMTKEAADQLANLQAAKAGQPAPHDASWLDMGYTVAPGALIAAGLIWGPTLLDHFRNQFN